MTARPEKLAGRKRGVRVQYTRWRTPPLPWPPGRHAHASPPCAGRGQQHKLRAQARAACAPWCAHRSSGHRAGARRTARGAAPGERAASPFRACRVAAPGRKQRGARKRRCLKASCGKRAIIQTGGSRPNGLTCEQRECMLRQWLDGPRQIQQAWGGGKGQQQASPRECRHRGGAHKERARARLWPPVPHQWRAGCSCLRPT